MRTLHFYLFPQSRDAFERLMGPIEEILAQKIEEYKKFNEEALANHV